MRIWSSPLACLVGVTTLLAPGVATAGAWYYDWSCTGDCAPGQLAISGREGPFASREDCDYARDHDSRENDFVAPGNLGGLDFCYDTNPGTTPAVVVVPGATAPSQRTRIAAVEMGVLVGPGWLATDETGTATRGAYTLGIEADSHAGRDLGGGSVQLGFQATRVEAAMLGTEAHTFAMIPLFVGLVLTPKLAGHDAWSVRADLGASVGGILQVACSGCAAPVFDETLTFGYTLKAGLDLYLSRDSGVSLDVIMPRWPMGSATPGNLLLEAPAWMVRLSAIERPKH